MIELITGTPGACKTLSCVHELARMLARWEKHPEEARPIFVHNVKDLALPHAKVPVKEWKEGQNKPAVMVPDWDAMPEGSWVLVDEAQDFFPPRSSASTPPPHVAFLNTHRHRGFDIKVVTQHPKLIDGSVRALVGKHRHYRRMFGRKVSYCYEWDACSDSLAGLNNAVGSTFTFPKNAFSYYKSAEVHTKQTFRLPKFLLLPIIGLGIGAFTIPHAFSTLTNGVAGKGLNGKAVPVAASAPAASASAALAAGSAPAAKAGLVERIKDAVLPSPKLAGCLATATRCSCIEADTGKVAKVEPEVCKAASVELGGLIAYEMKSTPGARPVALLSPSAASSAPVRESFSMDIPLVERKNVLGRGFPG